MDRGSRSAGRKPRSVTAPPSASPDPRSPDLRRQTKKPKGSATTAGHDGYDGQEHPPAPRTSHKSTRGSRSRSRSVAATAAAAAAAAAATTTTTTAGRGAPGYFRPRYHSPPYTTTPDAAPRYRPQPQQQPPPPPSPPPPPAVPARAPSSSQASASRGSANEAVPPRLVSPWSKTTASARPNPHVTPPWEGIRPPRRGETEIDWYLALPDPWPLRRPRGNHW